MATLQKIRDKAGVLIAVVIGLSLLAFILGDFLGKGTAFSNSDPVAGEIKGYEVPIQEYQQKVDEFVENAKRNNGNDNIDAQTLEQIYDQAWEALVNEYTMNEEYKELGLSVSADELTDMIKGKYIDPQIQQIPIFQDPQTKVFDKSRVISFLKNLDQDPTGVARSSWLAFEKALIQSKVANKYNTLIQKAYYANNLEVKDQVTANNESVNFEYIYKKSTDIKDEDVSFTDNDLKKYYDENLYKFKQEESRNIMYVSFDITPSNEDVDNTRAYLENNKEEFATTEDAVRYINLNSDELFNDVYYAKGELAPNLDSIMFSGDTGVVSEIYLENNAFKIAKLVAIKDLPDSTKARHILLQPSETMPAQKVIALADSLKGLLENGADFAELAKQYSKDGSAQMGGELGWFKKGQMVKPFERACFEAKKGDVVITESQFGLHVIEVEEVGPKSKKVQVGYLTADIEASEQTDAQIFNKASKFAAENNTKELFDKAVDTLKLVPRLANNLKKTDRNIAGLESPRELIRWAYNNELNAVSTEVFKFGEKYVIAVLTEIREKGTTPFDLAKTEVENYVLKLKKQEKIEADFKAAQSDDLSQMATTLNLTVQKADKVTFNSFSIPGIGTEPAVIANVLYSTPNTVISPVVGLNGVFALKASEKIVEAKSTEASEKIKLENEFSSRVNFQAISAIKENANIVDNRLNYY